MSERFAGRTMEHQSDSAADEAFMTAREAGSRLGVAERTIRRAIARGDLPATKRSGIFEIAPADLNQFLAHRPRGGRRSWDDRIDVPFVDEPGRREPSYLVPLPARSMKSPAALPLPLTSLVGREREIAALVAALQGDARLVTLTGPGGVGKTRLALAVAAGVAAAFPDGVWYVGLDSIGTPGLVAPTIARVLGIREAGAEPIAARLESALRERHLLLLLDNFEQVVEAAPLVADLLAACPRLKVLVTSRARLRISGERERAVPPLDLAQPGGHVSFEDVARADAIRLFVERAQAAAGAFVLTPEHAPAVATICQRLDGLPLAIELAAARLKVLPPTALAARLERRLPVLTGGSRDAPARLRTMRDAIAWSYDLLTDDEQTGLRRLAVFVGGFTLEAAEAVTGRGVEEPWGREGGHLHSSTPLDLLAALVDKSLLRAEAVAAGEPRYGMLETIREFGLERLAASGEEEAVRQRHAEWYLAYAEDAGPRAKQPGAAVWVASLEREHPNLRAALGWLVDRRDGPRLVRMAGSLWPFWQEHTYFGEGLRWLEIALDLGREAPPADRIPALTGAGTLAWYQTQLEQALAWHEQALELARQAGDRAAEAFSLINIFGQAFELGDHERALASIEAGLATARAVGETEAEALALHNLACLAWIRGELATASERAEEALALARQEGWDWLVPMILVNDGLATADRGDLERAAALLREGLTLGHARGNLGDIVTALEGLARVGAGTGEAPMAVRFFGAAATLREEIGMALPPSERAYYAPFLTGLRAQLGEAGFAAAWTAGRSITWQTAMAEAAVWPAAADRPGPPRAVGRATAAPGLTKREREILHLLAVGESNWEIAERLFISPTTVASHVANVYGKLGVDSRAKATAYAHRHGLA